MLHLGADAAVARLPPPNATIRNAMARRRETDPGSELTPEGRERLQRIVVQLLGIAGSSNTEIQYKLRQVVDQLVELLEQQYRVRRPINGVKPTSPASFGSRSQASDRFDEGGS